MKIKHLLFFIFFVFACKTDTENTIANIVNVRLEGEPEKLNPILTTKAYYKQVEWQIFMPLLQYDAETLELHPVLAISRPKVESIDSGEYAGGRKYTFEIRPEATWDDGQPVVAEDFIFSLKTLLHPQIGALGYRSFLSFIKRAEVDPANPKKITIYTNQAMNLAEEVLGTMAVYPSHFYDPENILEKYDFEIFTLQDSLAALVEKDSMLLQFAERFKLTGFSNTLDQVNGCGPYEIAEWIPGQRIVLKKKKNWWAAALKDGHQSFGNEPAQLIYQFVEEGATLTSMLKDQNVDVAANINPSVFEELKKSELIQHTFNFYTPAASAYSFIALNTKTPKLSDQKTRLAIAHLVNVDEAIEVAMNGYAQRTTGPILPTKSYFNNDLKPIDFNIEKAKQLLKASGWNDADGDGVLEKKIDGLNVDFALEYKYTNNNPVAEKIGLLLKNNAIKAGIIIDLLPLEYGKLIEETRSRDFDLYFSQWSQRPGLDDLSTIWHTQSDSPLGFNKAGFGNAYSDALIDSINLILEKDRRKEMYYEIQEIIYQEQPYIFLFVPTGRMVVHKRFEAKPSALRPGYFENTFGEAH